MRAIVVDYEEFTVGEDLPHPEALAKVQVYPSTWWEKLLGKKPKVYEVYNPMAYGPYTTDWYYVETGKELGLYDRLDSMILRAITGYGYMREENDRRERVLEKIQKRKKSSPQ